MMLSMHLKSSRLRRAVNRAAALVVLGLQVAMGTAALWEPRAGVRLGVHIEQGGAQHTDQHAEESCVVCAVAATPPEAREIHATVDPRAVTTRSRAPPAALEV
jgi:hypothetical protein